jgi:hypothetical protein
MAVWKGFLPAGKVHVPFQLEEKPFQSTRYMYLAG